MKFFALVFLALLQLHALEPGTPLPTLSLKGDAGGKIDGTPFDSDALREKVHVIFYVDPDEKDLNNPFSDALKAQDFNRSRFASVAVINMGATWLPNFAIASSLEAKQKQFPDTLYVKDMDKNGVKTWKIADDNSDIIIVDKQGTVLYVHEGEVPAEAFDSVIAMIKEHM